METIAVTAAKHETARKFIDNDDFAILDDVILIAVHHEFGTQCLNDEMVQVQVFAIEHVANAEHLFDFSYAGIGRRNGLLLFIHGIIISRKMLDDSC